MVIDMPVSKEAAFNFLRSKGVDGFVIYERTIFNVDTDSDIANMFKCAEHWVKVSDGVVVEWYTEGYTTPEGEEIFGVSRDLVSGDAIDEYRLGEGGIRKTDPAGNITITTLTSYDALPSDIQEKLVDFPFKDRIVLYSRKPYGDVIEYKKVW